MVKKIEKIVPNPALFPGNSGSLSDPGISAETSNVISVENVTSDVEGLRLASSASVTRLVNPERKKILDLKSLNYLRSKYLNPVYLATLKEEYDNPFLLDGRLDPNLAREKIILPGIDSKVISRAKENSIKVMDEVSRRFGPKKRGTSYEIFISILEKIKPCVSVEEEALTAFYCVENASYNPEGIFRGLPLGFANYDNATLNRFVEKVRAIGRHVIVDLREELKTARDLEKFSSWNKVLKTAGVSFMNQDISMPELLQIIFPGILQGFDPPVRMWHLLTDKISDRELKKWHSAWMMSVPTNAFDLNEQKFDLEEIVGKRWTVDVFLANMAYYDHDGSDPDIKKPRDYFRLAAEFFGVDDPIGIETEKGKIPPWYITQDKMWTTVSEGDRILLDDVSEYLLTRHLPAKFPEYFDEDRNIKVDCISKIDWDAEYNDVANRCLYHSGSIKPMNALKRVRPVLFGFGDSSIIDQDFRYLDKWGEKESFRTKFVLSLIRASVPVESLKGEGKIKINFKVSDFIDWFAKYSAVKGKGWSSFFSENGLMGFVINKAASLNRTATALGLLLNKDIPNVKSKKLSNILIAMGYTSDDIIEIEIKDPEK